MHSFPWLSVLLGLPVVGAIVIAVLPSREGRSLLAKQLGIVVSLAVLVLTIIVCARFSPSGGMQFREHHSWISQFGVSYSLGVDGIALVLVALTAVVTPIVLLAGWHDAERAGRTDNGYVALILLVEAFSIGVFAATDVFLFYVIFEAVLVPMYFLIGRFGGTQRSYAAVKFLLYSLAGGLLMLAAVIGLYVQSAHRLGTGTFDYSRLVGLDMSSSTQRWLFLGFFIAFAVKAPLVPFHTWLPDAASESTPGTAVMLVGVLDKIGTFGMIRFCLPLFPEAARWFTPLVIVLAVAGILYGALLAIGQTDIMRLIAYTSVSHFGFITLGIFAMTSQGQAGSTLYMVNHGFSTAALFLVAGLLIRRRGSRFIPDFGGWQRVTPFIAGSFLIAGLSGLALPGLSSFVSEFLVLAGTFTRYRVAGVVATLGIVLAALYIMIMIQRVLHGPRPATVEGVRDATPREVWVVAPLLAILLALGFYPRPVLDVITPAVSHTLTTVGRGDPAPSHPVPAQAASGSEGTSQ